MQGPLPRVPLLPRSTERALPAIRVCTPPPQLGSPCVRTFPRGLFPRATFPSLEPCRLSTNLEEYPEEEEVLIMRNMVRPACAVGLVRTCSRAAGCALARLLLAAAAPGRAQPQLPAPAPPRMRSSHDADSCAPTTMSIAPPKCPPTAARPRRPACWAPTTRAARGATPSCLPRSARRAGCPASGARPWGVWWDPHLRASARRRRHARHAACGLMLLRLRLPPSTAGPHRLGERRALLPGGGRVRQGGLGCLSWYIPLGLWTLSLLPFHHEGRRLGTNPQQPVRHNMRHTHLTTSPASVIDHAPASKTRLLYPALHLA